MRRIKNIIIIIIDVDVDDFITIIVIVIITASLSHDFLLLSPVFSELIHFVVTILQHTH